MKNEETGQPKIKKDEFTIEEIISAASGIGVRGVDFLGNYDKISSSLKNSIDYKYDDEKSLAENIYAAFPQYKLREVTEKFIAIIKSWKEDNKDKTFINNVTNATIVTMASGVGIPQKLIINAKEEIQPKEFYNGPIAGQHSFGYYEFKDPIDKQPARSTGKTLNQILTTMDIRGGRSS